MDQHTGLFSHEEAVASAAIFAPSTSGQSLWIRPILLTAVSEDGTDFVQLDARKWLERAAKDAPMHIVGLCSCWFTGGSEGAMTHVFEEMLHGVDSDSALFLTRMRMRGSAWTCSLDRAAVAKWLTARYPIYALNLDPLMGA